MFCKNVTLNNRKNMNKADKSKTSQNESSKNEKNKKSCPTICIISSSYKIVQQAAKKLGLQEVGENKAWNLLWTDALLTVQQCRDLKRYQMVNCFPGICGIARKDLLARNLSRMEKIFPEDYNFFPKTWWLPADLGDLLLYARSHRNETFIVKPGSGSQGRGIFLTKSTYELEFIQQCVCQLYIPKPYLIDGFKFDIRIYVVITSYDPLRIFAYNEGIVRFATEKYSEPTSENVTNVFMHLTNYAINKSNGAFIKGEEGSKRRISKLNSILKSEGVDVDNLWNDIDSIIVKTILPTCDEIKHQYHLSFPRHAQACFVLLGFDVLLDQQLKPYVIEVNRSPSLNMDSPLDLEVKEKLLVDTLRLVNLGRLDQQSVQEEEKRRVIIRTQNTIAKIAGRPENNNELSEEELLNKAISSQIQWEENNLGNFRNIYPSDNSIKYEAFLNNVNSTLYLETTASRLRKELISQHHNELLECSIPEIHIEEATDSDSSIEENSKTNLKILKRKILRGRITHLNSFEPQYISTAEERERLKMLEKRNALIKATHLRTCLEEALAANGHLNIENSEESEEILKINSQNQENVLRIGPATLPKPSLVLQKSNKKI